MMQEYHFMTRPNRPTTPVNQRPKHTAEQDLPILSAGWIATLEPSHWKDQQLGTSSTNVAMLHTLTYNPSSWILTFDAIVFSLDLLFRQLLEAKLRVQNSRDIGPELAPDLFNGHQQLDSVDLR